MCASLAFGALALALSGSATHAAEAKGIVETVKQGCKAELESYCKSVTPGEGRIYACLVAHEDKLSGRCQYALYDASSRLDAALVALGHLIDECGEDAKKHCGKVQAGEGRILDCLKKNESSLTAACKQALKDTGATE
jgi:hypothetical protein